MKRSKAPSVLLQNSKKPKFETPFSKSSDSTESKIPKSEVSILKEEKEEIKKDLNVAEKESTKENLKNISIPTPTTTIQKSFKTPFPAVKSDNSTEPTSSSQSEIPNRYFRVLYCKRSNKKHKSYEDAIMISKEPHTLILKNMEGKEIGKSTALTPKAISLLKDGSTLDLASHEVEINSEMKAEEYLSGRVFLAESTTPVPPPAIKLNPLASKQFKSLVESNTVQHITPRHSPDAPGALVLYSPTSPIDKEYILCNFFSNFISGKAVCAVVVDPHLSVNLRPHQREGVQFMFDCVMGFRQNLLNGGKGCIVADEMGLGKTLQAITLIWTFLKQSPHGTPTIKKNEKIFVVTPVSVVQNWGKEFKLWLGSQRIKPILIGDSSKSIVIKAIEDFKSSSNEVSPLMVIGYEQLRQHKKLIQTIPCGLVICDEGHKLKNSDSKLTKSIDELNTLRRIILSGTPIQNDLEEYFAMCNLVNSGVLGTYQVFKTSFASPIILGRESNATKLQKLEAEGRSETLSKLTSNFILRRTSEILDKYLPPKVDQVLFCSLTPLQTKLYRDCIDMNLIYSTPAVALEQKKLFPTDYSATKFMCELSGKMSVLDSFLKEIRKNTNDKVVLVSHSTKTLNVFELMCKEYDYSYLRLDGQTGNDKRQKFVDRFNDKDNKIFLFLLSTKAGGVGLNLIGANRLVLFDSDWNPAHDRQAMARVWRDGQRKQVWIYRMLSTGTIEEKIYQRQITKQSLSNSIVDGKMEKKNSFSKEELKDIFTLHLETSSDTHDLLDCNCDQKKESKSVKKSKKEKASMEELLSWNHNFNKSNIIDEVIQNIYSEAITCVFSHRILTPEEVEKESKLLAEENDSMELEKDGKSEKSEFDKDLEDLDNL